MNNAIKICLIGLLASLAILLPAFQAQAAQVDNPGDQPWEKFAVNLGVFLSALDTSFRIGSGVGLDIDVEEALDLDTSDTVFRTEAMWRFSENRRHRLDFSWFSFKRDGNRLISEDITFEDKNGDLITIDAGTRVEANFDLDIYQLAYSYSFIQDERIDLAAGIGFYIMPLDFGLRASGAVETEGSEDFTAPLPVVGLRMDIALTPQWFIRTGSQVFYLEYNVINLTNRFVLEEEFSELGFMISRIFSSRPDWFHGSL
ncbi:MAG: hypothetical protein HGJ94_02030, partial [Desulfosarcina sp.]|nr:hypothetical protein [Desulfosarcina sp.]